MKVHRIIPTKQFEKRAKRLPTHIQKKMKETFRLFKENPFHNSLHLHQLHGKFKGKWAIYIDSKNRIMFEPLQNGDMLFLSVGPHNIYD